MLISVTIRQLQMFVAVAENSSYAKAARVLGISQPALTAGILRLEELLGVRLLDRTTRSVTITSAGAEFLVAVRRVLAELSSALSDAQGLGERRRGEVRIACVPSVAVRLVGPVMREYLRLYPGIAVKMLDGDATSVVRRVRTREVDFGITSPSELDDEVEFKPLLRDRWCVVCSSKHALAAAGEVRFKDLAAYPFLMLGRTTGAWRILDHVMTKAHVQLSVVGEVAQLSTLCAMIESGVGVSILPEAILPAPGNGCIIGRKLVDPVVERDLGLVTVRRRTLSSAADAFRMLLIDHLPKIWRDFTVESYLPVDSLAADRHLGRARA